MYLTNISRPYYNKVKNGKSGKNLLSSIILKHYPEPIYLNMIYIRIYRICIIDHQQTFQSGAAFWKPFPTHRASYCNIKMFTDMCQHAILVGVNKKCRADTGNFLTPPGWLICSGIASGGMTSSEMTTVRKGLTEGLGHGGLSGSGDDSVDSWIKVGTI